MNDIDFIKWMCEKAEGFVFDDSIITLPNGNMELLDYLSVNWNTINYPLLLQRAIEGVNNKGDYRIDIGMYTGGMKWFGSIYNNLPKRIKTIYNMDSIDQAKEQALRYIYQQEQG